MSVYEPTADIPTVSATDIQAALNALSQNARSSFLELFSDPKYKVTVVETGILPVLDAAAGVSWQTGAFTWQAGYELTAFLNLDQRVNFTGAESISRGQMTNTGADLGLEGVFVRLVYNR